MALPDLARTSDFPPTSSPAFLIYCQFSTTSPPGSEVTVTPFPTGNNVITSATSLVSPTPKGEEKVSSLIDSISPSGILKKKKKPQKSSVQPPLIPWDPEEHFRPGPTTVHPQTQTGSTMDTEQRQPGTTATTHGFQAPHERHVRGCYSDGLNKRGSLSAPGGLSSSRMTPLSAGLLSFPSVKLDNIANKTQNLVLNGTSTEMSGQF